MPANQSDAVYDPANEALVLRAAIGLAQDDEQVDAARKAFRALMHALAADEFLVPQNAAIWRALRTVADRALEYTADTVRTILGMDPTPVEEEYLSELESTATVAVNLEYHVETLRWDATRARTLRGPMNDLVADLKDPRVTQERALSSVRAVGRALEGGGGRKFMRRPEELAVAYKAELAKRREQGTVWSCGFAAIDRLMSEGFAPGKTAVITGLSGSGKSTFAARLALNMAEMGRMPLVCAWEMGAFSTLDIMIAQKTKIPLEAILRGGLDQEELRRIDKANWWISKRVRFMENAFFVAVSQEKRRGNWGANERNLDTLEGYIAESGCDEVIMDLWDRLLADQSPDAVTSALYRQQNMHHEYNVHGTLLVQLRLKDVEKRADKRPTRESIKGVGTFVEVPDLIFGVHRDAQFKDVPDDTLEVICLKQRKGRANWAVRFGWEGEICAIDGGEEIPYNPGLESTPEHGDILDPAAIRVKPRRSRINGRDG